MLILASENSLLEALKCADSLFFTALDWVEGSDHALSSRDATVGLALTDTANKALSNLTAVRNAFTRPLDAGINSLFVEEALAEVQLAVVNAYLKFVTNVLVVDVLSGDDECCEESDDNSFHFNYYKSKRYRRSSSLVNVILAMAIALIRWQTPPLMISPPLPL